MKFADFSVSKKITILLTTLVIFSLICTGIYSYFSISKNIELLLGRGLEHIVRTGSTMIRPEDHVKVFDDYVRQDKLVAQSEHYKRIQKTLNLIKNQNNLKSEVYTVVRSWDPENVIFITMSGNKPFVGNALKISELLKKVFETGLPAHSGLYKDSEGSWVSAAAPIKNDAGEVIAALEVDYMANEEVYRTKMEILKNISIPSIISTIFALVLGNLMGRLITTPLSKLTNAANLLSSGNLDVVIENTGQDEIGSLSRTFNHMCFEINRLISETKDSVRMSIELQTAKLVQETLFSQHDAKIGPFELVGFFESASECGGDWWYYSTIDNKIYLWIGDATGHGVSAAIMTSAVRSAVAIIETIRPLNPATAFETLNRALFETTKGQIQMTLFLACIDLNSNVLTYSNASHDPPYLIHKSDQGNKLDRKSFTPLIENRGPRLGQKHASSYEETQIQLNDGDLLVFYTDGILDLRPTDGKWGEREFLKMLISSIESGKDVHSKMNSIKETVRTVSQGTNLADDVTLVLIQMGAQSSAGTGASLSELTTKPL